ncbi:hypothetical protein ABEO83_10895 [Bacillus glycinifermentans]
MKQIKAAGIAGSLRIKHSIRLLIAALIVTLPGVRRHHADMKRVCELTHF